MKKVMDRIKERAKDRKLTYKRLAPYLGVSQSQVYNYFSSNYRISFTKFVKLSSILFNEQEVESLIDEYIQEPQKAEHIREAAEWANNNGKTKLLSKILRLHQSDPIMKLYQLLQKRSKQIIDPQSFYLDLENAGEWLNGTTEESVFRRICSLYAFADLRSYNMIPFNAAATMQAIGEIQNEYLRESYTSRVYESLAYSELKRNNLAEAEKIARMVIVEDRFDPFLLSRNYMLNLLSEIYVFSDYEASIAFSEAAINHFYLNRLEGNRKRRGILEATHDFVKIHHNEFSKLYLSDTAEQAHYFAKTKESQKALVILEKLKEERGQLSPHQMYYKALATKKSEDMNSALEEFIKQGDTFYSLLPKTAILG